MFLLFVICVVCVVFVVVVSDLYVFWVDVLFIDVLFIDVLLSPPIFRGTCFAFVLRALWIYSAAQSDLPGISCALVFSPPQKNMFWQARQANVKQSNAKQGTALPSLISLYCLLCFHCCLCLFVSLLFLMFPFYSASCLFSSLCVIS